MRGEALPSTRRPADAPTRRPLYPNPPAPRPLPRQNPFAVMAIDHHRFAIGCAVGETLARGPRWAKDRNGVLPIVLLFGTSPAISDLRRYPGSGGPSRRSRGAAPSGRIL